MHPKEYDRFLAMKEEERIGVVQMGQFVRFEQSDFNGIVLNFMISGMHHPSLLEDPSFETLLNGKFVSVNFVLNMIRTNLNSQI